MTAERITITGVAEVQATLERIATAAATTPPDAIAALAGAIAIEAPFVTGELRGSVGGGAEGVYITAPYAAIVAARNDYIARGAQASEDAVKRAWETHIDSITAAEGAR